MCHICDYYNRDVLLDISPGSKHFNTQEQQQERVINPNDMTNVDIQYNAQLDNNPVGSFGPVNIPYTF